jgi:hypothetical protein
MSAAAFGQVAVGVVVSFAPPALPVYVQPPIPAEGYIWVPGYWAWDPDFADYYWVPGTWVLAPQVGYLWTPGYWAWNGGGFIFYEGYWGPVVGFYGGINYGFGYFGEGYVGGRWDHDRFYYNRSVTNVNVTNIHNVYNTTVINNTTVNRVSYSGGPGGVSARPTAEQEMAAGERRLPPVAAQTQHVQEARNNPQLRASVNLGKPPIAATDRPANFRGSGVVAAQQAGAPYRPPPANRSAAQPNRNAPASQNVPIHASEVQPHELPPPNAGDAKRDKQYQQQQQKFYAQQQKDHQQLGQQQEKDHQQVQKQHADQARIQQMEEQHQQQTQQMEARHNQQIQQMQERQAQPIAHSQPRPPSKP